MLQTAIVFEPRSANPATAVNAAGGTASVTANGVSISIAGAEDVRSFAAADLDWARAGWWGIGAYTFDASSHRGMFVAGYETPAGNVPTTGTATYRGTTTGFVIEPIPQDVLGGFPCRCWETHFVGDAAFSADFGARTVSGSMTNIIAGAYQDAWEGDFEGYAFNDIAFDSAIAGNSFSGTTRVTTAPLGSVGQSTMGANATGTIEGRFFGPSAQEAGAVWTLFDGSRAAIGTLSGKRP